MVTTVHSLVDTRIYFKEVQSLSKRYIVEYYAPASNDRIGVVQCSGRFVPLFSSRFKLGRIISQLHLMWLLLGRRYSLYHLHDPELIPLGLVLKLFKRRVIFDMHENVFEDIATKPYLSPFMRRCVGRTVGLFHALAQNRFDWFILAEQSYTNIMKSNKYDVIQNYPLLRNIEIPAEKRWKEGLVYVGSITKRRGIWNMLSLFREVAGRMPGSSLHLIGPVDEPGLKERIDEWTEANSLSDRVHFYGRVPNGETFDVLKHTGVGLCLINDRVFEGSEPTKVYEYMMVGLPVVVTNFPLWRGIVEKNGCGLAVDPEDVKESADAVLSLFKDEKRMADMGRKGMDAIRSRLHWGSEESKLLDRYTRLLA